MRALFIGSYPNPVEPHKSVFFRELIYQFAELGVECTVITPVSVTKYKAEVIKIPEFECITLESGKSVNIYRPRVISFSAKKFMSWNTIHLTLRCFDRAVLRKVKEINESFDFVYGHFFLGGGLTAAKVGRLLGIPAYLAYGECSFETEVLNKYGKVTRDDIAGINGIIAVSSANAEDLAGRKFADDIPVLLSINAINKHVFYKKDKTECRNKFGMPIGEFIIGYVGYFIERKGCNRVLAACEGLEGVKLAFAGKGPLVPKGNNVIFCKSLNHEDVADFLNALDVFVLPTLNEGCCNAIIEAMSCGNAIISSDLPFNYDVLRAGENAVLVDPNDINGLRREILRLRDDMKLRERLESEALKTAQELTIDRRAKNILEFIEETM